MKETQRNHLGKVSAVLATINALGILLSMGYSLHLRRIFALMFEEMEVALPVLTQSALGIPGAVWFAGSLVLLVALAVKELISRKWIPLLLNGLFVLLGIVYWTVFFVALMLPLTHAVHMLENG